MSLIESKILTIAIFSDVDRQTVAVAQNLTKIHVALDDPVFLDAIWAPDPVLGLPTDPSDNPHFVIEIIDTRNLEITAVFDISEREVLPFNLVALEEPGGKPMLIDPQLILEPDETPIGLKPLQKIQLAATPG